MAGIYGLRRSALAARSGSECFCAMRWLWQICRTEVAKVSFISSHPLPSMMFPTWIPPSCCQPRTWRFSPKRVVQMCLTGSKCGRQILASLQSCSSVPTYFHVTAIVTRLTWGKFLASFHGQVLGHPVMTHPFSESINRQIELSSMLDEKALSWSAESVRRSRTNVHGDELC
jgi:hypothetical protein